MGLQERSEILRQISRLEQSGVVAYVTGDRQGMQTQVNADQIPLFKRHIEALGKLKKITVVLYTRGGDTNTPWPIVTALREHCDFLQIFIPYCANSSGTLFTLGADEIVMGPFSCLSPIDPSVVNGFNPLDPLNNGNRIPIAVEEVTAYLELVEKHTKGNKIKTSAFTSLVNQVHPLALGNVRRSINLIRNLAEKMIELHDPKMPTREVNKIVKGLTTEFYAHSHLIGRREARELGLKVKDANPDQLNLMNAFYEQIKVDLKLLDPWNPVLELKNAGGVSTPDIVLERAFIQTPVTCDSFLTSVKLVSKSLSTPNGQQNVIENQVDYDAWKALQ